MKHQNPLETTVVMVAYGGVGEFLFQLDLIRRLERSGIKSLLLVKNRYRFFSDIVSQIEGEKIHLINAEGIKYFFYIPYIWFMTITKKIVIINSFNSLFYRLPTRMFYGVAKLLSARVIIAKHEKSEMSYEQIIYQKEAVWERNNRIVEKITGKPCNDHFPILTFKKQVEKNQKYIHIHPVGSVLAKSYPVKKLLDVLEKLQHDHTIVITMTPKEEKWYVTQELRDFVSLHAKNVQLISKYFSAREIISLIQHSSVFCTVNTGLLWLAIMLGKKVVTFDYHTDYEWNPSAYANVTRLSHDTDQGGNSLHHVEKAHDDGTYFESLYLITGDEAYSAIRNALQEHV
jgi:ADP-heptose:LPS heptosyltransferase